MFCIHLKPQPEASVCYENCHRQAIRIWAPLLPLFYGLALHFWSSIRLIKLQLVSPSTSFESHIGPTLNLNDPPLFEAMSNSPKSKELRNKFMPFSFKWSILVCVFQVRGFYVYVLEDFPCRFWWTRIHFPLKCKGFAILSPQHLFVPDVVEFDL